MNSLIYSYHLDFVGPRRVERRNRFERRTAPAPTVLPFLASSLSEARHKARALAEYGSESAGDPAFVGIWEKRGHGLSLAYVYAGHRWTEVPEHQAYGGGEALIAALESAAMLRDWALETLQCAGTDSGTPIIYSRVASSPSSAATAGEPKP